LECAKSNSNIFIEKPLAHKNEKKLKELLKIVKSKKLITFVGYMMRFHPAILKIKKLIENNKFGKIYYFYSEWGEFIGDWHPGENYKKSYSTLKKFGGGSSLTLSHDIDLMQFFFGKIKNIIVKKSFFLKLDVESITNILVSFQKKYINGFIHIDYLQKYHSRFLKIVGTKLSVEFFYKKNLLKIYENNRIKKIKYKSFKRNDLFISEIKQFINFCLKKKQTDLSVHKAYNNLIDAKLI